MLGRFNIAVSQVFFRPSLFLTGHFQYNVAVKKREICSTDGTVEQGEIVMNDQ